jgi:hypothetical protein
MTNLPQSNINQIVNSIVYYCKQRAPEALDKIFDNLPVGSEPDINQQLLQGIIISLQGDVDSLAWLCGYMSSEINCTEDNHRSFHPITELSKILIEVGMKPFIDFTPYLGCRLIIANTEKFEALPQQVKAVVEQMFSVMESDGKQAQLMNDALLQELVVR